MAEASIRSIRPASTQTGGDAEQEGKMMLRRALTTRIVPQARRPLHTRDLIDIVEQMSREALGNFELMVLLAILRVGEDAYGVPISCALAESSGREVLLGSVYAALERLEVKGLVASDLGAPTAARGGRAKRFFRVTAKGLREVRAARRTLVNLWTGLPALEGGKT